MINIKSHEDIAIMSQGGKIWSQIIKMIKPSLVPGVKSSELDRMIEKMILNYGAKASFKGYRGYRFSSCISINDEIVHGVPDETIIQNGDLVSIDLGILYRGWHVDGAITVGVGKISNQAQKLLRVTKQSLDSAIQMIKPNIKLSAIQQKIQSIVEENGFSVIRDLSGHGIGKNLQEYPSIPNYFNKNNINNIVLNPGMTFCLEPMVAIGNYKVKINSDGWTVQTADGSLSAHFEHTLAVTRDGYQILTADWKV